jgi:hypothetical protein
MKEWYTAGKEGVLGDAINLNSGDIRLLPVDKAQYTFSAAHTTLTNVPAAARAAAPLATTGKTFTAGTFDAVDPTISALPAGKILSAVICYQHGATDADCKLITYTDEDPGGAPLNIPGNGGPVTIGLPEGILGI